MKQVTKGQCCGYDTYVLHSRELEVTLLPKLGNNVISLWDRRENRDILRRPAEDDAALYQHKPYHFGNPLLVPPGRIRQGAFAFGGEAYRFDANLPDGNHIHGLHRTQAWCVSDIEEDEEGCAVTTELRTADHADWMRQLSAPLKLEMTFRLQDQALRQTLKVSHLGDRPIPFGAGYHTWFMIDGEPSRWSVKLPADAAYELDGELLPTGRMAPLGELEALASGMNLHGADLDTIFRKGANMPSEALLVRDDGYSIRYWADPAYFRHWVMYTNGPADRFLCLEPYTWLPDAPNVPGDEQLTGLITLMPGDTVELQTRIELLGQEQDGL